MDIVTYSDARARLKEIMDRTIADEEEIVITRKNSESVVMVSLETWSAIQETLYLLSTPNNARELRDSIAQLDAGQGTGRELIE